MIPYNYFVSDTCNFALVQGSHIYNVILLVLYNLHTCHLRSWASIDLYGSWIFDTLNCGNRRWRLSRIFDTLNCGHIEGDVWFQQILSSPWIVIDILCNCPYQLDGVTYLRTPWLWCHTQWHPVHYTNNVTNVFLDMGRWLILVPYIYMTANCKYSNQIFVSTYSHVHHYVYLNIMV